MASALMKCPRNNYWHQPENEMPPYLQLSAGLLIALLDVAHRDVLAEAGREAAGGNLTNLLALGVEVQVGS